MALMAYDRDGRLRICGKKLGAIPDDIDVADLRGYMRVCYGNPGHSGLHGLEGGHIEWLTEDAEYAQFKEGCHSQLCE